MEQAASALAYGSARRDALARRPLSFPFLAVAPAPEYTSAMKSGLGSEEVRQLCSKGLCELPLSPSPSVDMPRGSGAGPRHRIHAQPKRWCYLSAAFGLVTKGHLDAEGILH